MSSLNWKDVGTLLGTLISTSEKLTEIFNDNVTKVLKDVETESSLKVLKIILVYVQETSIDCNIGYKSAIDVCFVQLNRATHAQEAIDIIGLCLKSEEASVCIETLKEIDRLGDLSLGLALLESSLDIFKERNVEIFDHLPALSTELVGALLGPKETSYFVLSFFPKFSLFESKGFFQKCLDLCFVEYKKNFRRTLDILCSLTKYTVPTDVSFSVIVKKGLVSPEFTARKQSLYLLRKLWGVPLTSFQEKFLLIYEILEEKQVHLVTPAFPALESFYDCASESQWVLILIERVLAHDSTVIVRKGLETLFLFECNSHEYLEMCYKALRQLNDTSLFYPVDERTGNVIDIWFRRLAKSPVAGTFFTSLIGELVKIRWNAIPLFHVIHSLSRVPPFPVWKRDMTSSLLFFVQETLRTQQVYIRGAIQCDFIICLVNLIDLSSFTLVDVAQILFAFRLRESLKRNSNCWRVLVNWLANWDVDELERFVQQFPFEEVSGEAVGRLFLLIQDSGVIDDSCLSLPLERFFHEGSKRLYVSKDVRNYFLDLYTTFLSDCYPDSLLHDTILYVLALDFFQFLDSPNCESSLNAYLKFYKMFPKPDYWRESLMKCIQYHLSPITPLPLLEFSLHLFLLKLERDPTPEDAIILKNLFARKVHSLPWSEANARLRWSAVFLKLWEIFAESIHFGHHSLTKEGILEDALEALSTGGRECVVPILKAMQVHFADCVSSLPVEKVTSFVRLSFRTCFESRKSDLFWPSIQRWISMFYQKCMFNQSEYSELLIDFGHMIFAQSDELPGIVHFLMGHLLDQKLDKGLVFSNDFLPLFVMGTLFGPVPRKDHRIEADTCSYIEELSVKENNEYALTYDSRGKDGLARLQSLLTVAAQVLASQDFNLLKAFVQGLITEDIQMSQRQPRYYNNSKQHRVKHRCLVAILILESLFGNYGREGKNLSIEVFEWAAKSLKSEGQQPSVRYQLEWLIVRLCLHQPSILEEFWAVFGDAANERPGSVCSFISIAFHIAKSSQSSEFFHQCVQNILPWCMSQQFNVRLYGHTVLQKLWDSFPTEATKYEVIRISMDKIQETGNGPILAQRLISNFYFSTFDCVKHFSYQVLLWELPRLTNVAKDELLSLSTAKSVIESVNLGIENGSEDNNLSELLCATWIARGCDKAEIEEIKGIQKKYIPEGTDLAEEESKRKEANLILVASLIDKPTNLGGLCRTCEVFGVQELVLSNLQYIEDKQFTSLSTCAEKHVVISEVKPHKLALYLNEKKKQGYTLVGAEQTSDSVPLSKFEFPEKCLILLGNEKEGIPLDLLPQLASTIEVPQFGLVRSLNVHVTGAIFLWEYAKQHLCNK